MVRFGVKPVSSLNSAERWMHKLSSDARQNRTLAGNTDKESKPPPMSHEMEGLGSSLSPESKPSAATSEVRIRPP
eukprot:6188762-Alexandrium_andersonii.AAC.1